MNPTSIGAISGKACWCEPNDCGIGTSDDGTDGGNGVPTMSANTRPTPTGKPCVSMSMVGCTSAFCTAPNAGMSSTNGSNGIASTTHRPISDGWTLGTSSCTPSQLPFAGTPRVRLPQSTPLMVATLPLLAVEKMVPAYEPASLAKTRLGDDGNAPVLSGQRAGNVPPLGSRSRPLTLPNTPATTTGTPLRSIARELSTIPRTDCGENEPAPTSSTSRRAELGAKLATLPCAS